MFFRNATIFSTSQCEADLVAQEQVDSLRRLQRPGPLEMESWGFEPPLGGEAMSLMMSGAMLVTVGQWKRALPMAAVRAELQKQLDAMGDNAPVGGRARKRMLSDILERMMPQAPLVPMRVNAIIDPLLRVVVVDTASRAVAERVVHELRRAYGSFPALPLVTSKLPTTTLTELLKQPKRVFEVGDSCELKQAVTNGEVVKIKNSDLTNSDEVKGYLRHMLFVSRLDVSTDRVSVNLGEDLVLRRIKLLDVVMDEALPESMEDKDEENKARLAIMVGELRQLIAHVYTEFGVTN